MPVRNYPSIKKHHISSAQESEFGNKQQHRSTEPKTSMLHPQLQYAGSAEEARPLVQGPNRSVVCIHDDSQQLQCNSRHSHNALPVQVQHGCCNVMAECHCHCWVQLAAVGLVRQHAPVQLVTQSTLYSGSSGSSGGSGSSGSGSGGSGSGSSDKTDISTSAVCLVCCRGWLG
jgi:uncharacterized membrane protein YgcG